MSVIESPYLVPFDGSFRISNVSCKPPENAPGKKECKSTLRDTVDELKELQRCLYAHNRYALLLVFQAMDAAGKDGTIRGVLSGMNPAGFQVSSFKAPSDEELDHDFLWRTCVRLPERGRIGVFNRSYYEEVLVVRVHPEYLKGQQLPAVPSLEQVWEERFDSIRDHERHLARNGTVVLKFWLNVSRQEQRERFLARIDEPHSNWKFNDGDLRERKLWPQYMHAYEEALNATSRPWAPWYAIPADNKSYMRMVVGDIIRRQLVALGLSYPTLDEDEQAALPAHRAALLSES